MCLHKISLSSKRCIHSCTTYVRVAGLYVWNFSSSSRQKCPELFSGIEIKEQDVVARNLCCYFYLILFFLFSVLFAHPSWLCLLNRGDLVENCDNVLPQPDAHKCGLNFNIREFQTVNTSLLSIGSPQT